MPRAQLARWLTLGGGSAVVLLHALRLLLWQPGDNLAATVTIALFLTIPVLVCLPGVWRGRSREYVYLSLMSLVFFCHAALLAWNPDQRLIGLAVVAAVWTMFAGTILWMQVVPSRRDSGR